MSEVLTPSREVQAVVLKHQKFLKSQLASPFKEINQIAIERFEEMGFPFPKDEMYSFVNTRSLISSDFTLDDDEFVLDQAIKKELSSQTGKARLVFLNGRLDPSLSTSDALPAGVRVVALNDELKSDPKINARILKSVEGENDVFALLNAAFLKDGIVIDVAKNTQVEKNLEIVFFTSAGVAPAMRCPRLLLKLGESSELNLVIRGLGDKTEDFTNSYFDFDLGPNSSLSLLRAELSASSAWHFCKWKVEQGKDSRFNTVNAFSGSRLFRQNYEVHLKEQGAEADLKAVSVLRDKDEAHQYLRIHHEAPHCQSRQHFKNVVGDHGRSSVDGTVIVDPGAQLTVSEQLINNLMISENAHADNKPNLMIFADDVKCTHGATVGQIDEDQLFYLKARCFDDQRARSLLTQSFVDSIVNEVSQNDLRDEIRQVFHEKLGAI